MRIKPFCQAFTLILVLLSLYFYILFVPKYVQQLFDAYPQISHLQIPFLISLYFMSIPLFYSYFSFLQYLRAFGNKVQMYQYLVRVQHSIAIVGGIAFLTTTLLALNRFAHPAIYISCLFLLLGIVSFFMSTLNWRLAIKKSLQKNETNG